MGPFFERLSVVAALCAGVAMPLTAERGNDHEWQRFTARVERYVTQRKTLDLPLRVSANAAELVAAEDALADGVRALRTGAKAGDVFGADAALFRQRIDSALRAVGYRAADLLAEIDSEAPAIAPQLAVNARFDWRYGAFVPPCVLAALPQLPGGLQYRFVGRELVLVDIEAGIILDVMPHALAVN